MPNKMLIDASHAEETRVVVTRGNRVEEFDFESASRRQLRGNIYLAKVIRVEPSLQAAFVEYGGNRHGFLAFSEIHPDYYQIPVADRQALLDAEREVDRESDREDESRRRSGGGRRSRGAQRRNRSEGETVSAPAEGSGEQVERQATPEGEHDDLESGTGSRASEDTAATDASGGDESSREADREPELPMGLSDAAASGPEPVDHEIEPAEADPVEAAPSTELDATAESDGEAHGESEPEPGHQDEGLDARSLAEADDGAGEDDEDELEEHEIVEDIGGGDALEEARRPRATRRHYKIQEVIKRRQILLIQVVKEERGNKGAALTTYLSLAGRYAVLMPNTGKGGGISRKITSAEDRKRLKEIVEELEVPDGMGIILRTAGASRTKPEIKRDFEYLMRLWESVRELTLSSSAPALVYEEGSLIKRAIRDIYSKEIDEVIVAGEEGYREAKDFMRMILPSHAKAVQPYREPQALFAQHGVEAQLDAMFSNHVTLKSGGYIVINPTEALVSIDVNSGRSTREHNIEDTATRTNMEAAEEIARQLRLRDLAGLIVIDFIDMEEGRNDRAVEKKLKDCLKNDRARIQVGRISPFGLLEMSRQRIRTGVLESSSVPCRHCAGTGFVRAVPSVALQILRSIEESLLRSATHDLVVRTRTEVAFYILNQKRSHLSGIEARFGVAVLIAADETLAGTTTFAIDRGAPATPHERPAPTAGIKVDTIMPVDEPIEVDPTVELEREEEDDEERVAVGGAETAEEESQRRRRRRRRRGGRGNGARELDGADRGERGDDEGAMNGVAGSPATAEADEGSLGGPTADAFDVGDAAVVAGSSGAPDIELPLPSIGLMIDAGERDQDATRGLELGQYARLDEEPSTPSADLTMSRTVEFAAPALAPEPEPEPVAVVLTTPDPDRPKRGGWWSKAKAAVGGA